MLAAMLFVLWAGPGRLALDRTRLVHAAPT
jgi:hypothetical protein